MTSFLGAFLVAGLAFGAAEVAVTAEPAPADLGELGTGKDVLLAAGAKGKEVYLYSPEERAVHRFLETGESWGEPIPLGTGAESLPVFLFFDAHDGRFLLAGRSAVHIYDSKGRLLASQKLFQPGDAALLGGERRAVSLTNVPHPVKPGLYLGRRSFGSDVPRIAIYDGDDDLKAEGLTEEKQLSASAAAARGLRLAWSGRRLFAAEEGNYVVHVLDPELDVRSRLRDPELDFIEVDAPPGDLEPSARELAVGRNLAGSNASEKPRRRSIAVEFSRVIADIAWGEKPGALYLLLDSDSFESSTYAVDVLDPLLGEVRRTRLNLPEELKTLRLKQLAVGRGWVWVRGYRVDTPVLRVDRQALEAGEALVLPDRWHAEELESLPAEADD